ncbi:MAG TPA: hypothetical protein VFT39_24110 [Vicinamibacterales bacterium]|nr:hypothetical protein [Vicinamibacterales bacterium]
MPGAPESEQDPPCHDQPEPPSRALTRDAQSVRLHEEGDDGKDDEDRNNQQRHTSA